MLSEYERMINGQLYDASVPELAAISQKNRLAIERFNQLSRVEKTERYAILKEVFQTIGEHCHIESPFYVDYGCNISVGNHFYANYDCILLDVGPITIGDNVMFGPRVSLYTATHPLDSGVRNRGLEYAKPIVIGDRCWLGGNVVVNPGVTIGSDTVVASGSVVTKDLPSNVLAAGNPCRVIRELGESERVHWEQLEQAYHQAKEQN